MKLSLVLAVTAAFTVIASAPDAAELLVVEASSMSEFDKGHLIPDGAEVVVPAGSELTVISETGEVIRIVGPYSGVPDDRGHLDPDPGFLAALKRVMTPDPQVRIGATRGVQQSAEHAESWSVDVTTGGTKCISAQTETFLRRSKDWARTRIVLITAKSNKQLSYTWQVGNEVIGWPESLPIADRVEYLVSIGGRRVSHSIMLRAKPDHLERPTEIVAWMSKIGCEAQAKRLLATIDADAADRTVGTP